MCVCLYAGVQYAVSPVVNLRILSHWVLCVEVFCQEDESLPRVEVGGLTTDHRGQFRGKKFL